jgi:hypothetical protein
MRADLAVVRPARPTVFTDLRHGDAGEVLAHLRHALLFDRV